MNCMQNKSASEQKLGMPETMAQQTQRAIDSLNDRGFNITKQRDGYSSQGESHE